MSTWVRLSRYFAVLGCLLMSAWVFASACSADSLYVGDFDAGQILQYNATTGAYIGTFGPAIGFPLGGALGPNGDFYAVDDNIDTVLLLNGTTGATINSTFATGVTDAAGVAFGPTGNLFVVGSSTPGLVTMLNGTTGAVISTSDAGGILGDPEGITRGPDGNIYVAGGDGADVQEFNGTTGTYIKEFVASGSGGLMSARGLTFGPDGNLYVTSFDTDQVLEYNGTTGAFIGVFASPGTGTCSTMYLPRDVQFGSDGNLFVTSYGSGDVFEFNGSTGACVSDFVPVGTGGISAPLFLTFGPTSTTGTPTAPEPSSIALLACALAAVAALKRRNSQVSA
jgi:WD40 repeat protein